MSKILKDKRTLTGALILGAFLSSGAAFVNAGNSGSTDQGGSDWKERMSESVHRSVVRSGLMSPEEAQKSHQKNIEAWSTKPQTQPKPQPQTQTSSQSTKKK